MEVKYETDNLLPNHSLETDYDSFTVEYSEDTGSKPVTESLNESDRLGINWSNVEDTFWAVFDERYLKYSLGWTITLIVAYTLIFLIGFVGNSMVILVFIKRPQMRTVTNMFIVNLAVVDLLLIIFCVPVELGYDIFKPWVLGSVMCKVVRYMEWLSICASAYSLAAISLDRCKAICRPQVPPRGLSKRQTLFTTCLIWTLSITLTIPLAVFHYVTKVDGTPLCIAKWEYENIYFVVMLFIFFCFPLNLIFISNVIIWWNISKRKVPEESASTTRIDRMHRKSRQSVRKMLGIVTLAFLLCWLPLYVLATKQKLIKKVGYLEKAILYPLAKLLALSNSSMNPVFYAFWSIKFREMFKSLLPKWVLRIHRTEKAFVRNEVP